MTAPEEEHAPTFMLDRWIARARREMGAKRWAELNAEWETSTAHAQSQIAGEE